MNPWQMSGPAQVAAANLGKLQTGLMVDANLWLDMVGLGLVLKNIGKTLPP